MSTHDKSTYRKLINVNVQTAVGVKMINISAQL
jgi:hypothetical protein